MITQVRVDDRLIHWPSSRSLDQRIECPLISCSE